MKKLIITGLICGFLGFVAGNAFWYLASPLWIDRVVSEGLSEQGTTILAQGEFADADSSHKGSGTAQAIATAGGSVLRFTEFEVTNGPDLYVWLVKAKSPANSAAVKASEWIELGVLKGNIGDQNYMLPPEVNLADYGSVVVWCRQFGVLFASADLNPV